MGPGFRYVKEPVNRALTKPDQAIKVKPLVCLNTNQHHCCFGFVHHLLVGGLEHFRTFFPYIGNNIWYVILPIDFHSYFSRWLKHVKTC